MALPNVFDNNVGSVSGPDAIFAYCKAKAESLQLTLFGADVKNCRSGDNAKNTYNKYGHSNRCVFSNANTGLASGQTKYGSVFVYGLE